MCVSCVFDYEFVEIQLKKRVIEREREKERSRESDSVTLLIYDASYTCNKSMEITNGIQINGKNENYFKPMIIFPIDLGTIFLVA